MPVMYQAVTVKDHHLEILVIGIEWKVALDDAAGPGSGTGNDLGALPWRAHIRVVMPIVNQVVAFECDYFKVFVIGIEWKVALDDAAGPGGGAGNHLGT